MLTNEKSIAKVSSLKALAQPAGAPDEAVVSAARMTGIEAQEPHLGVHNCLQVNKK